MKNLSLLLKDYTFGVVAIDKYLQYKEIPNEHYYRYPWMKSAIVFIFNFSNEKIKYDRYQVARFSFGIDYHIVVKEKLESIAKMLGLVNYHVMTDISFLDEKLLAYLAGIGNYGRNNLIINNKWGTNFAIGEIITDKIFTYSTPINKDPCIDCSLCLRACPTKAITEHGFTKTKCISYLTQYISDDFPLYDKVLRLAVGCDICQDVCPHNKKYEFSNYEYDEKFKYNRSSHINLNIMKELDKNTYKIKYKDKSFNWIGYLKMLRNILTLDVNNKNISLNELNYFYNKHKSVDWFRNHLEYLKGKLENGNN